MLDVIRAAEKRSLNVVALSDLLAKADGRFRKAVISGLIREGFELDEPLPCLQHPKEVLEALQWLAALDFGATWDAFSQALHTAARTGILLDLRRKAIPVRRGRIRLQPDPRRPRLELA